MAGISDALYNQLTAYTWSPLVSLSRRTILNLLSQVKVGQLVVADSPTNTITVCGLLDQDPQDDIQRSKAGLTNPKPLRAELRVLNEVFWIRLVLFGDMVRAMTGQTGCHKPAHPEN